MQYPGEKKKKEPTKMLNELSNDTIIFFFS